jgi:beta-galactosidase
VIQILRTIKKQEFNAILQTDTITKVTENSQLQYAAKMIATFPPTTPDWCNLKVLHRNTLPPRATFFNYKSVESALTYNIEASETLSLNGTWKFHLASSPFEAPVEFHDVDFDTSKWSDIPVPSVWQLQGFSNPQYLNKDYGFPIDPPHG